MSQQQTNFERENRDGLASYKAEYQGAVPDNEYTSRLSEQKLSRREEQPTAAQRLALAIVSLVILFLTFIALIVVMSIGVLAPSMFGIFVPIVVYMILGLVAVIIVINAVFNRKH